MKSYDRFVRGIDQTLLYTGNLDTIYLNMYMKLYNNGLRISV